VDHIFPCALVNTSGAYWKICSTDKTSIYEPFPTSVDLQNSSLFLVFFLIFSSFLFLLLYTQKMKNIKNAHVMTATMNINDALIKYLNTAEIAKNIERQKKG
jgi:hypothetical protein